MNCWSSQAELSQANLLEAVSQDRRVLQQLPQGSLAQRAHPLQRLCPRSKPLRQLLAQWCIGPRSQSFYYPPVAQTNCNGCHMPQLASEDFGSKFDPTLGKLAVHDHFFPGANTALPYWRGDDSIVERATQLLKGTTRIDIFGIREGGVIEGKLTAPLDKELPTLNAGSVCCWRPWCVH